MTAMRQSTISIANLANRVSELSTQIIKYLDESKYAHPDFTSKSPDAPETYAYEGLRNQLTDGALDLVRLVSGSKNTFRTLSFWHTDLAAIQVALHRKFFECVPDDNIGLSASEVAKATSIDVDRANRILKMLATHRIFEEAEGKFHHTAASVFLKKHVYAAMAEEQLELFSRASGEMSEWVDASPLEIDAKDSPFFRHFGELFYDYHDRRPEKAKRFSDAMRSWSTIDNSYTVLRDRFEWSNLTNTKVVDIGGGNGHVCVDLAREFQNLTFTVQDYSDQQLCSAKTDEVGDRVTFQQYDFYTPQPIRDAGVYLCRATFHNHNDEEAIKMLRALIPALEGRLDNPVVLISDCIVPELVGGAVTMTEANRHRQLDLLMLALFGAKERTESDWNKLCKQADERLQIVQMHYETVGAGLLEVRLLP